MSKNVSDGMNFWNNIKSSFSDKGLNSNNIKLVQKQSKTTEEREIADVLSNYFINITKSLELKRNLVFQHHESIQC